MAAEADKKIQEEVQQSLNGSEHNLSQVYTDIFNRPGHHIEDSSLVAANKALHDNGFPDIDIVGIDKQNHIMTVDKESKELQFRDSDNFDNIVSSNPFSSLNQETQGELSRIIAMDREPVKDQRAGEHRRSEGVLHNQRGDAFTNDQYGYINEFQYKDDPHSYKITNSEMYNLTGAEALQTPDGRIFKNNGKTWDATDASGNSLGQFRLGIVTANANGVEADGPDARILNLPQGLIPVPAANPK